MYVATVDIIPLMLQDTSIRTIFIETLAMMLGLFFFVLFCLFFGLVPRHDALMHDALMHDA